MENNLKKIFLGIPAYSALGTLVLLTCWPVIAAYSALGMDDKVDDLFSWIGPFVDSIIGL